LVSTLSGGEQKRLVLEALLRGSEEVLMLDEADNYLDVPAKRWLEDQLRASPKTVLFISHDRELLDRVATRVATLEPGTAGSSLWVHAGRFSTQAYPSEPTSLRQGVSRQGRLARGRSKLGGWPRFPGGADRTVFGLVRAMSCW
jgi:ATPase subunit of ABC transporter with duplicated ATPase domains